MERNRHHSGFTLIELVLAMSILAVVSSSVLVAMGESARQHVENEERSLAVQRARSLMEEVLAQAFEDPHETEGSFGNEEGVRQLFDDVDDYDLHAETPVVDAIGLAIPGATAFTRSVEVHNVLEANPDVVVSDGSTDFKRVTVIVQGTTETLRLYGLKAK